jgi:hypothetical protein
MPRSRRSSIKVKCARGDWRQAHYGRFLDMWTEYGELKTADPAFEPARPVQAAFARQPYDVVARRRC